MPFTFEERPSDSPLVQAIWRTQSERSGSFISAAAAHWEMVLMRYRGKATFTVRGISKTVRLTSRWVRNATNRSAPADQNHMRHTGR